MARNNQPKTILPQGKYVSTRSDEQLAYYQKRKTIFMLLSTLFFAVSLFLPVDGREFVAPERNLALGTSYILFDIVLIVLSVFISYQGFRRHKITAEVAENFAPKYGYDRLTFITYEIFNIMHILQLFIEVALGIWLIEAWGIVNMVVIAFSTACSIVSRQYLFRANRKHMTYLPPFTDESVNEGEVPTLPTDNSKDIK